MKVKHVCLGAVLSTVLCLGQALAQPPALPGEGSSTAGSSNPAMAQPTMAGSPTTLIGQPHAGPPASAPMAVPSGPGDHAPPGSAHPPIMYSRWIQGTCPDCCGPIGGHTPIRSELFVRSGISWITGNGILASSLDDGWKIEGGGRALFFNHEGTRAFTVEGGIGTITHYNVNNPPAITLRNLPSFSPLAGAITIPQVNVRVKRYNRTYVHLGAGMEWYLIGRNLPCGGGCGDCDSCGGFGWAGFMRGLQSGNWSWRVGVTGGGRWGASKLEFIEIPHRDDVIGALYGAIHTDVEVPCGGCCIFFIGLRLEYNHTWSDILQTQNEADTGNINLLVNTGLRF